MNQDQTLRGLLIVGFVAVIAITLYHRIESWKTRERLDRRREGLFILATARPAGLLLWLGVILYMINPDWMRWSSVDLPLTLRWIGIGLCAGSIALLAWTLPNLGRNLTDTVVTRRAHTLVTKGPYRWVRHPFYDSVALLILGTSLVAANWFLLLTGGVLFALLVVRTRTEEELLIERFGDAYRNYMERTGRFLPRIVASRRAA